MFIIFLIIGFCFLLLTIYTIYKFLRWIFLKPLRIKWFAILSFTIISCFIVKKVFFTYMEFIPSKIYSNLYIVKNPVKDREKLYQAILYKIKEHSNSKHLKGKKLSYTRENAIYFYEYGGRTFGFIGEAGTGYFIDHEEDLGGFVSEELGMYRDFRITEFYYINTTEQADKVCGELNWFEEGIFIKKDTICNLKTYKLN